MRFSTTLVAAASLSLLSIKSVHGYGILGMHTISVQQRYCFLYALIPDPDANYVQLLTALLITPLHPHIRYPYEGHTLTGQVAQLFLTPETARQVKEILSPYYDGLLSKAAPWPDTIKGQAKYRY